MADTNSAPQTTWTKGQTRTGRALVVVIVLSLAVVLFANPQLVTFWPFTGAEFLQLITPLFLIALLIERVVEVFVAAWRNEGSKKLKGDKKDEKSPELIEYRAGTQRFALILGVTLGIIVATVGVRLLGQVVDPAVFASVPQWQQQVFVASDVVLTGTLLGGGADALHQVMNVFTSFMQTTTNNIENRAST